MMENEKIYISAISLRLPGVSSLDELAHKSPNPDCQKVQLTSHYSSKAALLSLDPLDPFHPNRKDSKVLRPDTCASVICVQELLKDAQIKTDDNLIEYPIFMANGYCLDRMHETISEMTQAYLYGQDELGKNQNLMRATPPTFVLKVLSNASLSFVSQYGGIKGHNTCLGNTSHSGYYVLQDAMNCLSMGKSSMAFIGSSSGAGVYSAITYRQFIADESEFFESENAIMMLLETESSLVRRNIQPLAQIIQTKDLLTLPTFEPRSSIKIDCSWNEELFVIHSGGLSLREYQDQKACFKESQSLFHRFGSLGPSAPLFNMALGVALKIPEFICYDQDPYGRQSILHLSLKRGGRSE